jgi:alkylation response protein AidB-like acyl-CoA dehydrogenase
VDFKFSEEQTMLESAISRFLSDRYSFDKRREILAQHAGFDPVIWGEFATSLGILGATLPEEAGGLAGGAVETMIIMEALGQALVVEPYLETVVIGGGFLKRSVGQLAAALLPAITSGDVRIAFAATEPTARYVPNDIRTTARREGEFWVLNGEKSVVDAAPAATHLIVTARTSGDQRDRSGVSLLIMDKTASGLTCHNYRLIDDRSAADLKFENVRLPAGSLLTGEGQALPLIEQILDEATAAVCAEAVGLMRRMLHDTIEYTKQRRQFGQPLASFQVLQHRMVDMYMALEQSVSAVYLATLKLDADALTRAKSVSAAKASIGQSARMIGQNAVQLHGAMGMTDELPLGHYFKRATVIEGQFGTVDHHIARYAQLSRAETP